MDLTHLQNTFLGTFDPARTKEAENHLDNELCYQENFLSSLMQLITTPGVDPSILQAGAVYFKNHLDRYWTSTSTEQPKYLLSETDKQLVRNSIVDIMVAVPIKVKPSISTALSRILANDYPKVMGNEFVEKALTYLQSQDANAVYSGLLVLYQLAKRYEHKSTAERQTYYEMMPTIFFRLYELASHCQDMETAEQSMIVLLVLKIVFSSVYFKLPPLAQDPSFVNWMNLFIHVANNPVKPDQMTSEEPFKSYAWRARKWAAAILYQLTNRYGIPTLVMKEYKAFAKTYVTVYAPMIVEMAYSQLLAHSQGTVLSPRLHKFFLSILETAVSHSKTWAVLKNNLDDLISAIIFPPLCHSAEDEQLWQEDPHEYIREKFDPMADYISPAKGAEELLLAMVSRRQKATLMRVLAFCDRMMIAYSNSPPEQRNYNHKDGVLCIVGVLAETINSKPELSTLLEPMLLTHVVPEFDNPHGFLRARANWIMPHFASIEYSSPQILVPIAEKVLHCLSCGDLPVQVTAAVAIQSLLNQQPVQEYVRPHLPALMQQVIALTNEAESEDLTHVLQDLVLTYGEELGADAAAVANQLSASFLKMAENDLSGDEDTNKAMTAMGLLHTMQTLVSMFTEAPQLLESIEKAMLPTVEAIFKRNMIDFYEEAMDMLCVVTFARKSISPEVWTFFPVIYQAFKADAFDFFSEMMPVYDNFIHFGGDVFLANPDYIQAILDMCSSVFASELIGESAHIDAFRLLESLLLVYPGKIDMWMSPLMATLMVRASTEFKMRTTKVMYLETMAETLYYNASMALQIMETTQPGSVQIFFNTWFENLDHFKRVHDLTVVVAALCEILSLPESDLPPSLLAGIPHIVPALLKALDQMPAAKKLRKELLEDSDVEEDEDEDMDDDDFEEEDDEEDDYLEKLEERHEAEEEDDQSLYSDDDSDDDVLDEEDYLMETALDKTDVYMLVEATFQGRRGRPKESFDALISALSNEDQAKLVDAYAKAKMAAELQEAEQHRAHGYQFFTTDAPKSFQF